MISCLIALFVGAAFGFRLLWSAQCDYDVRIRANTELSGRLEERVRGMDGKIDDIKGLVLKLVDRKHSEP